MNGEWLKDKQKIIDLINDNEKLILVAKDIIEDLMLGLQTMQERFEREAPDSEKMILQSVISLQKENSRLRDEFTLMVAKCRKYEEKIVKFQQENENFTTHERKSFALASLAASIPNNLGHSFDALQRIKFAEQILKLAQGSELVVGKKETIN